MHHITHIDNLESILKNGLKSRNELLGKTDIDFKDTADPDIIQKRGILNNYIPFHSDWIQNSHGIPYNFVICNKYGYDNIIFLYINPEKALKKFSMKYFLYHPISNYCIECENFKIFSEKFKLEKQKLIEEYNFNYSNEKVKEFRMSEFIILENTIFLDDDWSIIVYSEESFRNIKEIIEKYQNEYSNIKIFIEPDFFRR